MKMHPVFRMHFFWITIEIGIHFKTNGSLFQTAVVKEYQETTTLPA